MPLGFTDGNSNAVSNLESRSILRAIPLADDHLPAGSSAQRLTRVTRASVRLELGNVNRRVTSIGDHHRHGRPVDHLKRSIPGLQFVP